MKVLGKFTHLTVVARAGGVVQSVAAPEVPQSVQDTPEVAAAKAAHAAAHDFARSGVAVIVLTALVATSLAGYLPGGVHSFYSAVPSVYAAQYGVGVSSIHHAQDVLGQYNYGYASPLSAKNEVKTADGVTRGGYTYVDANGQVQSVSYTADPTNGFRVAASNLPQAPVAPAVEAPRPVEDTVEVAAAKSAHLAAVARAGGAVESVAAPQVPQPVQDTPEVAAAKAAHAAAHDFARSGVAVVPSVVGYSAAVPGVVSVSAPASGFAYSAYSASPVYSTYRYAPVHSVVLTSQGVPVDTPEVQAARAADAVAHIQAKAALLG